MTTTRMNQERKARTEAVKAGAAWRRAVEAEEGARARRDSAILTCLGLGLGVREVARLVNVQPGTVQHAVKLAAAERDDCGGEG